MQSVPITTKVQSLNLVHDEVFSIQHYVLKFVRDLPHTSGFLRVLRFPPPIKLTTTIQLKYMFYIVESGVKHHNPVLYNAMKNAQQCYISVRTIFFLLQSEATCKYISCRSFLILMDSFKTQEKIIKEYLKFLNRLYKYNLFKNFKYSL